MGVVLTGKSGSTTMASSGHNIYPYQKSQTILSKPQMKRSSMKPRGVSVSELGENFTQSSVLIQLRKDDLSQPEFYTFRQPRS